MGRKARRKLASTNAQATSTSTSPWAFIGVGVTAVVIGAAIALSVAPHRPVPAKATASVAAPSKPAPTSTSSSQPSTPIPPPNLTIGLSPDKVALNLGNWSYDQQNWPMAIAYYNEAIRRGIDDPDIRTDLGNAYRFNGDLQTAVSEYQTAQKQNPNHENSLFNQGGVYGLLNQPQKAVDVWQDYLKRFPKGQHVADAHQLIAATQAHAGLTASTTP
jgi:Flp pilus assembly protein TadD